MSRITSYSDNIYLQIGLEALFISADVNNYNHHYSYFVVDDGIGYLYFLDIESTDSQIFNSIDSVAFVLKRIRLVVPLRTPLKKLEAIVKSYGKGLYKHISLTATESHVLKEITTGVPSRILIAKMKMSYKTWHNYKGAGLRRVGIRNMVTFMRFIHIWKLIGLSYAKNLV